MRGSSSPRAPKGPPAVGRRLLASAPSLVALLVLAQIVWLGLLPAIEESRRLERDKAVVAGRVEALLSERARLATDKRKLDDPVYAERIQRSLHAPGPVLTLGRDSPAGE